MIDFRKLPLLIAGGIAGGVPVAILISYFGAYGSIAITWSLFILFIIWYYFVGFGSDEEEAG